MFHFDDQSPQKYVAECEDRIRDRPHAGTVERASNRDTALGKRERERERERETERERERERVFSFVIRVDPSRAFTLRKSGGKQGKGKQHIRSYRLLPQTWPKSLSLSLSKERDLSLSL